MGHALAARRYGIATRDITLLPIGGVASLEQMPEKPAQELVVALAAPAVNIAIAAIIIPAVLATQRMSAFTGAGSSAGGARAVALHRTHFLAALGATNVFLVVFNMIPALPMDYGRMLRAILATATDRARATAVAAAVGQVLAVGFVLFGLFTGHVFLMMIGVFVFLAAGAEAQAEKVKSALDGLPVRAAVMTRFRTLRASQILRHAAEELLAGSQHNFPVLADDADSDDDATATVGVLTRTNLGRSMAAGKMDATLSTIMRVACATVGENDDLRSALERARGSRQREGTPGHSSAECLVIAVVRPDPRDPASPRIVGLITPDKLTELDMLRGGDEDERREASDVARPGGEGRRAGGDAPHGSVR